ncbi:MAG TPA: hypothetical protein VF574_03360 [Allosphingosinicella sp.]
MDRKQEQTAAVEAAQAKSEWIRPDLSRFAAGDADASDINNTDGPQTS